MFSTMAHGFPVNSYGSGVRDNLPAMFINVKDLNPVFMREVAEGSEFIYSGRHYIKVA
jgi:hypothetical protein